MEDLPDDVSSSLSSSSDGPPFVGGAALGVKHLAVDTELELPSEVGSDSEDDEGLLNVGHEPPSLHASQIHNSLPQLSRRPGESRLALLLHNVKDHAQTIQTLLSKVPPADGQCMDGEGLAEVFSQPRLVPLAGEFGISASLSFDILMGWDLLSVEKQISCLKMIQSSSVQVVMLSPPCTAFSKMQDSNWNRMPDLQRRKQCEEGAKMLVFACAVAQMQSAAGRFWVLEHPHAALSWKMPPILDLMNLPNVKLSTFDMCLFGLCSITKKLPMRKRSHLLSNLAVVDECFGGQLCKNHGDHASHQVIQGCDAGVRLSVHAQCYPEELCRALLRCVGKHLASQPRRRLETRARGSGLNHKWTTSTSV